MAEQKEVPVTVSQLARLPRNIRLQAKGTMRIIDKDGNVKGECDIVALDDEETTEDQK
jgi:hypothetical protein